MSKKRIAILGAGNLGVAIARGIANSGITYSENIVLTRRNTAKIGYLESEGFEISTDNKRAKKADIVFLCVQPKQLSHLLEEIDPILNEDQVLVSVVTGVDLKMISSQLSKQIPVIRSMPNTAIAIGESMTCICSENATSEQLEEVQSIYETLGSTLIIEERLMKAATVLGASGIAFFLRYIRAATQGGIELGFDAEEAQKIAMQTARGAASLLIKDGVHPEMEIDKVTTPQGCTIAGLNEMEHQGLSSALIKGIKTSYERINSITK
jgi:pyrroline-5-carboxylate reductase